MRNEKPQGGVVQRSSPLRRSGARVLALGVLFGLMSLSLATSSGAQPPMPQGFGSPSGPPRGVYTLSFAPSAAGSVIDKSVWATNWFGSTPTAITPGVSGAYDINCFDPQSVTQTANVMHMVARQGRCLSEQREVFQYRSGIIHSVDTWSRKFGYFEAQIKFSVSRCTVGDLAPKSPFCMSNHPAFWLTSRENLTNSRTQSEIDIAEGLQGQLCNLVHYWVRSVSQPEKRFCVQPKAPAAWHTYGVLWEATVVSFYIDGKLLNKISLPGGFNRDMFIVINHAVAKAWTPSNGADLQVTNVRHWHFKKASA